MTMWKVPRLPPNPACEWDRVRAPPCRSQSQCGWMLTSSWSDAYKCGDITWGDSDVCLSWLHGAWEGWQSGGFRSDLWNTRVTMIWRTTNATTYNKTAVIMGMMRNTGNRRVVRMHMKTNWYIHLNVSLSWSKGILVDSELCRPK